MASTGNAGSLFFGMTLDTKEFKKRLKGARKQLKEAGEQMRASLASIATGGAVLATAVAAGSAAMLAFAKNTAEATNEQLLLADSIGATQSEIAALEVAAQKFGVENTMLIDKMREAGGIDAFKKIADEVKGAGNATAQLAKAQELLGNEGLKLLPVLQLGASGLKDMEREAFALGAALSPRQIAETRVAWNEYESTLMSIQGLAKQLGTSLMKPFARASAAVKAFVATFKTDIVGAFKRFSALFDAAIKKGVQLFVKYGIPFIKGFIKFGNALGKTFESVFNFISDKGKGTFKSFGDFFKGFIEFMATFKQVFIAGVSDVVGATLKGSFNALGKFVRLMGDRIIEYTALLEEMGAVKEGTTDKIAMKQGEMIAKIRGMGKDLAKPFEIAAKDNIDEAAKILEDLWKDSEDSRKKFEEIFKNLKIDFSDLIEDSAKAQEKVAERREKLATLSAQRTGLLTRGSQEEASVRSQSQAQLDVMKQQLAVQKKTQRALSSLKEG